MDPLAHTLFGAALAEAGFKRVARGATVALIIGANLPDIDVLAHLRGMDAALYARRGWTHGVLAMALLPLLLWGAMLLWQRWRPRPTGDAGAPARPRALLAVACVAVWSHPLLDWLNTYGVRLLMPFDGRWFYGDTLFIVDPWVWLMLACGVVLARSSRWPARMGWALLAGIASWLIVSRGLPQGVVLGWSAGLAVIVALRWRAGSAAAAPVARAGLVLVACYSALVFTLARHAEASARERHPVPQTVQANPVAGVPWAHRIVLAYGDRYRIVHADGRVQEFARAPADATVRRALADPSIRGFATWARFPWWQVEHRSEDIVVRFHDLRYSLPGSQRGGIGYAEVTLPRDR